MNKRILLVDDETPNLDIIRGALRKEGYELISTDNPYEGLELLAKESPTVLILDLRMPDLDGLEFLNRIQKTPNDNYSIIILTGHGTDNDIKKCYKLGVSAFLRKPVNMIELRGLVANLVQLENLKREKARQNEILETTVAERTSELNVEIEKRKEHERELEKKNIALTEILNHLENEKKQIVNDVLKKIELTVFPHIQRLKDTNKRDCVEIGRIIEKRLRDLNRTETRLSSIYDILTPREIEICELIREGQSTKQIADNLIISPATVSNYRKQVRKKLNLSQSGLNLYTFLKQNM